MFFRDNYAIKFASSFIVYPLNISLIIYGVSQVVNFFRPFTIWLSRMIREKFRIRIYMLAQAKVNYMQFIEKTVAMDHYFP